MIFLLADCASQDLQSSGFVILEQVPVLDLLRENASLSKLPTAGSSQQTPLMTSCVKLSSPRSKVPRSRNWSALELQPLELQSSSAGWLRENVAERQSYFEAAFFREGFRSDGGLAEIGMTPRLACLEAGLTPRAIFCCGNFPVEAPRQSSPSNPFSELISGSASVQRSRASML